MSEFFDLLQLQLQVLPRCFSMIHKGSRHPQWKTVELLGGADVVVVLWSVPDAQQDPRKSLFPVTSPGCQGLLQTAVLAFNQAVGFWVIRHREVDLSAEGFHGGGELVQGEL